MKGLNAYFELIVHNQRFICAVFEVNMIIIVSWGLVHTSVKNSISEAVIFIIKIKFGID